jgi:hypothetical protein
MKFSKRQLAYIALACSDYSLKLKCEEEDNDLAVMILDEITAKCVNNVGGIAEVIKHKS